MDKIIIRLPEDVVNYLQLLQYTMDGLVVLHTHALNASVPFEARMEIRQEFQKIHNEYELAKQEMWAHYASQFSVPVDWHVDFQTGNLEVTQHLINGGA